MPVLSLPSWQTGDSYSRLKLGAYTLGPENGMIVTVGKVHSKLVVDHKKGAGVDGGGKILRGLAVREVTIDIEIYDLLGELSWDGLAPILMPLKDPKKRDAWPVDHPALARHGITLAVVVDLFESAPNAKGTLTAGLVLSEHRVRAGATGKPKATQATTTAVPAANLGGTLTAAPYLPGVTPPSQRVRP